jgi:hypothetical protein
MKKLILVTILCFSIVSNFLAQTSLGVRYGIGINYGDIQTTSPLLEKNATISFLNLAGVLDIKLGKYIYLSNEFTYTEKGTKAILTLSNASIEQVDKVQYLGYNILPKLQFGTGKLGGFFVVGPGINFILDASGYMKAYSANGLSINNYKIDYLLGFDVCMNFGGGITYRVPSGKIVFDARYCPQLTNTSPDGRLYQIGLSIGYLQHL